MVKSLPRVLRVALTSAKDGSSTPVISVNLADTFVAASDTEVVILVLNSRVKFLWGLS